MNAHPLIALLCLIGLLITIGGCGGGEDGPTTTTTAPAAPEPAPGREPEPEPVPGSELQPEPEAPAEMEAPEPEPEAPSITDMPEPEDDGAAAEAQTAEPPTTWGGLLEQIVTEAGLVRYERLAEPSTMAALDTAIRRFAEMELPEDEQERLALWCNAYNANVLAMALAESRKAGFINVLEVQGFFDGHQIIVAGETMTLNELENDRIRPLGDPRVYAALVCAAMSCPPLRDEPYIADRLDEQLDDQCRRWVNDSSKFRMVDGKLGMSEILKWYGEDFRTTPYGKEIGFVLAYANPSSRMTRYILNSDRPQVSWIPYDWSLNQAPHLPGEGA